LLVIITLSHFIRLSNCRRKTAKRKTGDAWDDLDKISKKNTKEDNAKIINNAFKEIPNRLKEAAKYLDENKSFEDNFTILVFGLAYGSKPACIENFAGISKGIIQDIDKLASSAIDESAKKVTGE